MQASASQKLGTCRPALVPFHGRPVCAEPRSYSAQQLLVPAATRRQLLALTSALTALGLLPGEAPAVEQGVLASDYTVPALGTAEYLETIKRLREDAWAGLRAQAEAGRFTELANSLVLTPIDDIRQAVLYIPAALLKEGRQQAAISSRRAYTDFIRDLKRLDETAMAAARYDKDEEDVVDAIDRLSSRLDAVISAATK